MEVFLVIMKVSIIVKVLLDMPQNTYRYIEPSRHNFESRLLL